MTDYEDLKNIFIHIFMNFDELNINYEIILSIISKNGLKTHPLLDYAILKFNSSTPALDYEIIKLWHPHTRQRHAQRL